MSQFPSSPGSVARPSQPQFVPPRRVGNAAAIASVTLGFLGCIPAITGVLAVVFGVIGLRRSREPDAGGAGLALSGLVLGLLSVAFWSIASIFVASRYVHSAPQRAMARQFLQDLSTQNIDGAMTIAAPNLPRKRVEDWSSRLSNLGPLKDVQFRGFFYTKAKGSEEWALTGHAVYATLTVPLTVAVVKEGSSDWKIARVSIERRLDPRKPPPHPATAQSLTLSFNLPASPPRQPS